MLGGKAAANALISHYKSVGNIELPEERIQEINQANRDNENPVSEPIDSCLDSKLTMLELEKALAQLKNKQAPGPDKASNDMLKHLGPQAKKNSSSSLMPAGKLVIYQRHGKKPSRSQSLNVGSAEPKLRAIDRSVLQALSVSSWKGSSTHDSCGCSKKTNSLCQNKRASGN